jgi:lipopolysaccharide export system protein LptA
MRLERIYAYHLVRVLRVTIPVVILALISILIWNYQHRSSDEPAVLPPPPKLLENVSELAEEIKFSQTEGGRTAFTVEARTNLGFTDGHNVLEDVTVVLYGEDELIPERRIHGDRCGYDQETNDIQCDGNVEMELDGVTSGRTDAMTYNHESRTITTLAATEIVRLGAFQGRADHMSLRVEDNVLDVSGNVRIVMVDGAVLETESARYEQNANLIRVAGGFRMTNLQGIITGTQAEIELNPQTLEPRLVRVWDDVRAQLSAPSSLLKLTANELAVRMSEGRVIGARAQGDAVLESREGESARILSGDTLDSAFDELGQIQSVETHGNGQMRLEGGERLESVWIRNELSGAISTSEDSVLQLGEYRLDGSYFVVQQGDVITFRTDRPASIEMPAGSLRGDRTEAQFDPDTRTLIRLVQNGDVEFAQDARTGSADRIEIQAGGSRVLLAGNSKIEDAAFQVNASEIALNQENGSFRAAGSVRTLWTDSEEPVLVLSGQAEGSDKRITFTDTAELWTGNIHVSASTIDVDPTRRSFVATDDVVSMIDDLRFWSGRMEFDQQDGILYHSGGVRALSDEVELHAADLHVQLIDGEPAEVVATGDVRVQGPKFDGQGDAAIYVRSSATITLTGQEAEVSDSVNGAVSGCRLVLDVETRDAIVESDDDCRVVSRRAVNN